MSNEESQIDIKPDFKAESLKIFDLDPKLTLLPIIEGQLEIMYNLGIMEGLKRAKEITDVTFKDIL